MFKVCLLAASRSEHTASPEAPHNISAVLAVAYMLWNVHYCTWYYSRVVVCSVHNKTNVFIVRSLFSAPTRMLSLTEHILETGDWQSGLEQQDNVIGGTALAIKLPINCGDNILIQYSYYTTVNRRPLLGYWAHAISTCFHSRRVLVYTARCTLAQSAVLRSHVVRPSV